MMAAVNLSTSLGALGLKRVARNQEMQAILRFGFSFVLPDALVDKAFEQLEDKEILNAIQAVSDKVDILLKEAQTSSFQLLRDAYIALEHNNLK